MDWNQTIKEQNLMSGEITNREAKEQIAMKIAEKVQDGDVIGIGSGSTSFLATIAIAKKIKEQNLNVLGIPASYEIELLCQNLGIPLTNLNHKKPNWGYDGADEVSPQKWLIKGRGGALFREKLIMNSSKVTYILVDNSKFVNNICEKFPIPIECIPESLHLVKEKLYEMGALTVELRLAQGKDGPIITEQGNFILDTKFNNIEAISEKKLKSIPGVLETGLFIGYNIEVITN